MSHPRASWDGERPTRQFRDSVVEMNPGAGLRCIGDDLHEPAWHDCPAGPQAAMGAPVRPFVHIKCMSNQHLPPFGKPLGGSSHSSDSIPADHHAEMEVKAYLAPPEIYQHIADAGAAKLKGSFVRELVLGILAGCYIGFGFSLCMLCAGQLSKDLRTREKGLFNFFFGAFGFPFGLTMCVLNGSSLFTSNVAYMAAAFIEGKAPARGAVRIVAMSWATNFIGALLLGQMMLWGQVYHDREDFTVELGHKKTSYSFGATLVKGILCNWLVCMAVWQANAAQDIGGKVLGIFLPISAFVAMGFEHCVANMFMLPLSMRLGADINVATLLLRNLIPSTMGNVIGGGFFVATSYGLAFGAGEKAVVQAGKAASSALLRAWPACLRRAESHSLLPTHSSLPCTGAKATGNAPTTAAGASASAQLTQS